MEYIYLFLSETVNLWLEISFYLLLGMLIAGLLNMLLGREFISRNLGKGGFLSIIKATILGIPLPVCSCGVIPLASSLKKDGADRSSVLSFLVSTPTTGVDSIFATYSLLGPLFAIFRPLAAFISGIAVGISDYLLREEREREKKRDVPKHTHSKVKIAFRVKQFIRYSFFEMPQDIGKWLIIGVFLGGLITILIPKELFSQYFSFPIDFLIALVVGVPLYVCATGSIPIAASLIQKGFSPGAALVFLIVGPATNSITLYFIRGKLGKKPFYIYLISIVVIAPILGLIFNGIWSILGKAPQLVTGGGRMLPYGAKLIAGIILFLLIANAVLRRNRLIAEPDLELSVPDIHCKHCKIILESKLSDIEEIERVNVDIEKKSVKIKGNINRDKVIDIIKKAGYNPK